MNTVCVRLLNQIISCFFSFLNIFKKMSPEWMRFFLALISIWNILIMIIIIGKKSNQINVQYHEANPQRSCFCRKNIYCLFSIYRLFFIWEDFRFVLWMKIGLTKVIIIMMWLRLHRAISLTIVIVGQQQQKQKNLPLQCRKLLNKR